MALHTELAIHKSGSDLLTMGYWLKEKYPALCEKAGLCDRIGGRLYTVTHSSKYAGQPPASDGEPLIETCEWHQDDEQPGKETT